MDLLYEEIIENLLKILKKYSEDKASYDELYEAFLSEDLVFNHLSWDKKEKELRNELFDIQKDLFTHLRDVERISKNIKKEMKGEEKEIDLEMVTSHSRMISRNKMPLEGYSNSNWFLPPCPNHNHLEALYKEKDEE
jgi:hypothetical protein